jgi:cobalt-zinc-cadmium efflux system outer membrane protein
MYLALPRPWMAFVVGICWVGSSLAQNAPTLREASDAAWTLSPQVRALQHREAELDARRRAASSFLSGPPSISLSQRTDRVGRNGGMRESEAEIAAPLWSPGVRGATAAQVEAERVLLDREQAAARARVAGEVRDIAAQVALADVERELAGRKLAEARALAGDVERRVRAGDAARVDLLQAHGVVQQASVAHAQASAALARLQAQWRAVTGLAAVAHLDEVPRTAQEHPLLTAGQAQIRAAESRLNLVVADRRDPVELGVGFSRERASVGAPNETSMRLSVRVPLGSYGRNAPRVAAARAELASAEAQAEAAQRSVASEHTAAASELDAARLAEAAAGERARLADDARALIARSYQLGETDLPARLRAETEHSEAQLAHARAQVETRRAISKLNQALGVLP